MSHGVFWLLATLPALAATGTDAPISWSADGSWYAYTVAARADRNLPAPGWIFGGEFEPPTPAETGERLKFRVYAGEPATGSTVLLEESDAPLTSPAWSPDGRALAYGRSVVGPGGSSRFEIVVQVGLSRKQVLLSRPELGVVEGAELPRRTLAWSPDGRYLAVPASANSADLLVIRADTGMVLKTVPNASAPAWSPDGSKLALIVGGAPRSLALLDASFGPLRKLADLGGPLAVPSWSRDGKSVLAVASRVSTMTRIQMQTLKILRIGVDDGREELAQLLLSDTIGRERTIRGILLSIDRDTEQFFSALELDEQPSAVVWYRPTTGETVTRFHPLGEMLLRVASIGVSPGAKTLAVRVGPGDVGATVGIWDTTSRTVTLNDPDDATRLEWLTLLISSARKLLDQALPQPTVAGHAVTRATVLPVPGEVSAGQESLLRLRRLGRYGRSLCDRPPASASDPAFEAFLTEACLFFDSLREDYSAALADLDILDARTTDPERRVRLLALRAQFLMGQGEKERAGDLITYLRSLEDRVSSRIEETVGGYVLTPTPESASGWSRYLAQRSDDLSRPHPETAPRGLRGLPIEPFTPNPPAFGGGFVPQAPEFVPPQFAQPDAPEVRFPPGRFRPRMRQFPQ